MGPIDSNAVPLSPEPPLRQLWEHADRHRPKVVLATIFSVLNKICDIAPELLIGAAVDVVVGEGQSFIGKVFGIEDRVDQLNVLAIITVVIWVLESLTDYIAEVAVAEPGPGHRARDADGRLPARPGARARLLRGPHLRRAHGRAQRRRQPARAVPRRRRQPDDPHDLQRGARRAGVLRHLAPARVPRLPADPGDRDRVAAVPEEARAPVRRRAGRGRRIADTLTNNLGGIATIKAFTAEEREVERVAIDSRAYGEANAEAIRSRARSSPSSAWRSSPASPSPSWSVARAVLNGDLEVGLYATLVYMTQRLLWPLTELGETLDLYQRAMASCRRIFGLLTVEPSIQPGDARPARRRCAARCASTT